MQQLFYRDPVPVSVDRHRDLSVKTGESFGFAARVNSVPLTAAEFAESAAEYPVVFATGGEAVFPVAILGVREDENSWVDATGAWAGAYIPAFVRRYPFVFSQDEEGRTFTLHVDESFPGANRDGRGERLFDADGEQTQFLRGVLAFVGEFEAGFRRTQAFCTRLRELDLLQPMQADFTLPDGARRSLTGFLAVDRARLKALPAETVMALLATDELECIFLHLASMRHFRTLAARLPAG